MSADSDQPLRKKVKHYDNGEPHFLTFSCYRQLKLLSKDQSRLWFVEALEQARRKHGFHLWAWVIIPEHVHVLLWPPFHLISTDPNSMQGRIEGILTSLKRPVGVKAVAFLRENAPDYLARLTVSNAKRTYHRFWQAGSGHDENVSEPAALHALVEYVHQPCATRVGESCRRLAMVQRPRLAATSGAALESESHASRHFGCSMDRAESRSKLVRVVLMCRVETSVRLSGFWLGGRHSEGMRSKVLI